MKIITKKRAKKAFSFLLFGFLAFNIVQNANDSNTAYATTGKGLVFEQKVEFDPTSISPSLIDTFTDLNKVIPISNNEYIALGSVYDQDGGVGYSGLIAKYADSNNDGNYEVAWYKVYKNKYSSSSAPLTVFTDAIQLANGNILTLAATRSSALSTANYKTSVLQYDTNGTLVTNDNHNSINAVGMTQLNNGLIIVAAKNGSIYRLSSDYKTMSDMARTSESIIRIFSIDNTIVAFTGSKIYVYDVTGTSAALRHSISGPFYDADISKPDNTIVTTNYNANKISKYSLSDGSLLKSVDVEDATILSVAPNGEIYSNGIGNNECSYGGGYYYSLKLDSNLGIIYKHNVKAQKMGPHGIFATNSGLIVPGTNGQTSANRKVSLEWYNEQDGIDYSVISYSVVNDDDGSGPDGIVSCGDTDIITGENFTPKKPTSEGYDFNGWYTDPELNTPFTDGSAISSDMTLYAKWERKTFYVSFDWDTSSERPEGINLPAPIPVKWHESGILPEFIDPTGYTHELYYESYINDVTSNKTIRVKYTKIRYPVTFIRSSKSTDNPSSYSPSSAFNNQSVAYQDKVDLKYPTASDGYIFNGYYTDDNLEHLYDANTPVTAETTLYYGWVNTNLIIKDGPDGGIEVQYPVQDGSVRVDENGNVVLDGFNGNGIKVETDKDVTIVLENENNVSSSITSLQGDVTITGDGTLTSGGSIVAPELTIDGTTVVTSGDIISISNDLAVKDSDVTANNIVNYGGDIKIENSNVEIDRQLTANESGDIFIKDSEVTSPEISTPNGTITVQNSSVAGDQLYTQNGDVTIQDSTITEKVVGTLNGDLNIDNSKMSVSNTLIANGENNINITNGSEVKIGDDNHNGMIAGEQTSLYVENSKLDIATKGFTVKDISVKNGDLTVDVEQGEEDGFIRLTSDEGMITLDGGSVNLHSNKNGFQFPALWIKDGKFDISSDEAYTALFTFVTQIDDGSLSISGSAYSCSMATLFATFNGGTTKISTNAEMSAICVDLTGDMYGTTSELAGYVAEGAKERGFDVNKGEYIVFNGGFTKLESTLASALVVTQNEVEASGSIKVANHMVMDPETEGQNIGIDTFSIVDGEYSMYYRTFSNGEKIYIDQDTGMPVNMARYVYIHPFIPAPNTDDEDNPNTVDFQILGLAGAIFIAVMFQGMVIADLYRRLHGYEEEINNIK